VYADAWCEEFAVWSWLVASARVRPGPAGCGEPDVALGSGEDSRGEQGTCKDDDGLPGAPR